MRFKTVGRASLALCFACLLWLCTAPAWAQETADVVGTVTDASGAVVPGATVTLTNLGTNVVQTTTTQGTGDYLFTLLQVGTYSIKVEAKGFKTFSAPSLALSSGDRARVDAKLEVGDVAQTVEVSGTVAPALQTDSSQVGSLVPAQSVEDLPLNGRNLIKLVQLTPGVTEGSPGSIVQGNRPDDRRFTSSFSVNGQTDTMNNNMIDGMDNNERIIGTIGVRPSIDAIQEVNVQTNKYDASVGRTGGGVVDVITKSGTNNFHGTAYEFFRNKVLNTNPNYNFVLSDNPVGAAAPYNKCPTAAKCVAAANPPFRQNQYGGSVGGPIKKDKTFFFGDYEGYKQAVGTNAGFYSVPTLCERGSVLAALQGYTGPAITCPDGTSPTQPGDFSDMNFISPAGGGSAQGGQGPVIPAASQTVLGRALFSLYPLPNTGNASSLTNNYTSSPERVQNSNTWDVRVDQHFSDKDTFYARFTHNGEKSQLPTGFPDVNIDPATGFPTKSGGVHVRPSVIAFSGLNTETQNHFAMSEVHVFNPNLILNLKAAVFRSNIDSEPPNSGDVSNKLGFPCTAVACVNADKITPGVVGAGLVNQAYTSINGTPTWTTVGDSGFIPLLEYDTSFQYMAGLSWNKGSHSVRFGLSLIRRRATIGQSSAPNGTFTFTGTYTGVPGGDLLEGLPIQMSRNNALDQPGFRTWEPSGYVQDDWRARSWLTLNIGLRYDIFTPYTEVHGRMSNYDPYLGLVVSPSIPGIQQSGPTAMVPTPLRDWAPRFGFAATLPHNAVIRGGFGLTFFPVNYESPYYMKNAPFNFSVTCAIQNTSGSANQCDTAQLGNAAVGQFANNLPASAAQYGLATSNSGSTVNKPGGALLAAGEPVPVLNIALATNTANYKNNGTIASVPVNLQENYLEQFNLEVQKQFGANVVNLGYVGQIGRHVAPLNSNTNQNLPANPSENKAGSFPMQLGGKTLDFGTLPGFPYFSISGAGAAEEASIGTSMYNAMQASFVRRFSHGLTVNFNYVWSHMTDNVDGNRSCVMSMFAAPEPCFYDMSKGAGAGLPVPSAATQQDCANAGISSCLPVFGWQHGDWGNGAQDVHDRFSWGVNYQLPFAKSATGIESVLIKGWAVNASGSWQTGLPFNVTPSTSTTNISGAGYLDQTCSGRMSNASLDHWFNVNCFNHPQTSTLGNMHPNQLFGPPQRRFDASLFKQFDLPKEGTSLEFRAEVFNLFNSPNFNTPSGTSLAYTNNSTVNIGGTATPAGQITAMNANWNQREIQFALKFKF